MPTPYAGTNQFSTSIAVPADGDPANASAFVGMQDLADRTTFFKLNAQLAIANQRLVKVASSPDRFNGACWGPGAGPLDYGLFVAAGHLASNGAGVAFSHDGELWYEYSYPLIGGALAVAFQGVAHGGSGALGSRHFVFCGHLDSGTERPALFSAPDDAEENSNLFIPEIAAGDFTSRFDGSALTGSLRSVCWNGTVFCAVGDGGRIVTLSADLATATVRTPGSSYAGSFYHVFSDSAGRLFAVGAGGEIQRSMDNGVNWTRVHSDAGHGALLSGVAITIGGVESIVVGGNTNVALRSTNQGAASSWAAVTLIAEAVFDTSAAIVFKLGAMLCAILRHQSLPFTSIALYSFDGGATWPYSNRPGTAYGTVPTAAASNDQRAIIVGGAYDDTQGHIYATGVIIG